MLNHTTPPKPKRIRHKTATANLLEHLRIETVQAQNAIAAGDADALAYHLPRVAEWARKLENVGR